MKSETEIRKMLIINVLNDMSDDNFGDDHDTYTSTTYVDDFS
jgi:hypothetical protein